MSGYTLHQQSQDLNVVAAFLARRDVPALMPAAGAHQQQADILILAGNSLPCTTSMAAAALEGGAARQLLITGGMGHATEYLRRAVGLVPALQHMPTANRPEAEIMAHMVLDYMAKGGASSIILDGSNTALPADQLLLETASANCGDNAVKSVELLQQLGRQPSTVLLLQDPTMQARSHASFQKAFHDAGWAPQLLSFAPFVPRVVVCSDTHQLQYGPELLPLQPLWPMDRFCSLIMGEVPRLRDGPGGYGPKGRGFIASVDVPPEIEAAYARLQQAYATRDIA